ncbi:L,D-transpeptidase [Mangrovibrevibacter kandeliae]|uniref:L,D-transpeptidase n=1 Tax=Mangrovibrevibacter kandeliae TaxID=2968473 RepID=UPI002118268B|nr:MULTISPECIES: L,D-transpeptidase [unclassified Aurantimonas]MCQ8782263.1 L,D-transpeptidase [Aurantimonas sp. CSK15Z-1]MCW4115087.1 L,D-transpeptidase [Aurantimonas sp. MSK8Z-1]
MNFRTLLAGGLLAAAALLSACGSAQHASISTLPARVTAYVTPDGAPLDGGTMDAAPASAYAARTDDGFNLPAIPYNKVDPKFRRQRVVYDGGYEPGTVVVDTANRFLYVVERGGTAMRYGIGVGKDGFSWSGEATIGDKQHWPKWFPPNEMIDRRPDLEEYRGVGMGPGVTNPLGARALYLYQGNKDTLYRLHGSPEWWSIGKAMSSGCIRLMNQDIIDLYERVPLGAKVVVLQGNERMVAPKSASPAKVTSTRTRKRAG